MRSRLIDLCICLVLIAATLLAYGDLFVGDYDFVNFDDEHYVRHNPDVHAGLTARSVRWALTNYYAIHWHPLTWISLQLDHEMYGLNPRGYHVTNLLLHAANTCLLFLALLYGTGARWPSAVVAAFFALHPLHVESVAWITERKDVLSTFFWMLTLLAYFRYAQGPGWTRYLLVLATLTLGLMSKPMVVTLPCVLLLLDYWPLGRWPRAWTQMSVSGPDADRSASTPDFSPASLGWLILEKIPMLLLAAGCAMLAVRAHGILIEDSRASLPFGWIRVLNAAISYVTYLRQMIWPSDLGAVYLHPMERLSRPEGLAAIFILASVSLAALYWRRQRPYFLVGWLWYLGTLVPVLGLIQVGMHAHADRFTYIPLIGIFLACAWGTADALSPWRRGRVVFVAVNGLLLAACFIATTTQLRHWRNSTTLWNRVIEVAADPAHACMYVASRYAADGDLDEALKRAEDALRRRPDDWQIHGFIANMLARQGNFDQAIQRLGKALELNPESADMHNRMGDFLWQQGRIPAANRSYAQGAQLAPRSAEGRYHQARVYLQQDKLADAVRCFREALSLAPDRVLYHCDLALTLEDQGDLMGARAAYREALEANPDWPNECARLAWLLATHPDSTRRDGAEATRRARQACSISQFQYAPFLETLAAAYAEAGHFKDAVATAEKAHKIASAARHNELVERLDAALKLYRQGQPFRDPRLK